MAAAYLAQEAFKEPIMALFLLAFALLLPAPRGWRDAIPLGVLAAGTVYVYSFPGLAWLGGLAVVWGAIELLRAWPSGRSRRARSPAGVRRSRRLLVVLSLPELDRLRDFVDFRALHPDRANEGGLGNLRGPALAARGARDLADERVPPLGRGEQRCPAIVFYAGALLAAVALAARAAALAAPPRPRDPRRARSPPRSSTWPPAPSAPSTPRRRRSRSPPR